VKKQEPCPPGVRDFVDESVEPAVRGFLHSPATPNGDGLVFTHGAGGNSRGAMLVEIAETFAEAGFAVLRCDLPFRQARAFGPPRPGKSERDRQGLKHAVEAMRRLATGRVFVGGQSYGGRQATMLCADEPHIADGLLLTSYPLHPPGKPAQLRTQHFERLRIPGLFVEGTKDPFGTIDEIETALKLIPSRTSLLTIEGAGHDLGFSKKKSVSNFGQRVLTAFQKLFE